MNNPKPITLDSALLGARQTLDPLGHAKNLKESVPSSTWWLPLLGMTLRKRHTALTGERLPVKVFRLALGQPLPQDRRGDAKLPRAGLKGRQVGIWTIGERVSPANARNVRWVCTCPEGHYKAFFAVNLRRGLVRQKCECCELLG